MPSRRKHRMEERLTPQLLGPIEWNSISGLLVTLWVFALVTITFAINLLIGHAIIPSLAYTRQLPCVIRLVRPLFYVFAALALGLDIYIVLQLGNRFGIIPGIYPRVLI